MILIYAHTSPARLQYICRFVFKEQLGLTYSLTIDSEGFAAHDGPKINYSDRNLSSTAFNISNHPLLFEKDIRDHEIKCFETNGQKAFFRGNESDDISFDIFAAVFYLISRYEEYLPHEKDSYGRYAYNNSLAYREQFLQIPLVNYWLKDFGKALVKRFPSLRILWPAFSYLPTYDIDMAWSFKSKGLLRNLGGFIKQPSLERLKVMSGLAADPFDSYRLMDELHKKYKLSPIYFFLVATSHGLYDKNISPYEHAMWQLIKRTARKYAVGLHPSWRSNELADVFSKEKKILEIATDTLITKSRQHYIKFNLPETFDDLTGRGFTDEYSMGYGSINGFRASVASSYNWYDLKKEMSSTLRIHPFCFMDANSFYEQRQDAETSYTELLHYLQECKKANGRLVTIFHNNFLGTSAQFSGWALMYEKFIQQLQ